jgi:polysaccharide export outer membrane protein
VLVAGLAPFVAQAEYEIGPGDVLKIVVLGQAEMSGTFTVDDEGMFSYPILGKIKAGEHTPAELERKLTKLLAEGNYLKRPQVSVTVSDFGSQKVFVMGEVQRPGQYALKTDRTLLALLADIGPLGPNAGHEVIVIRAPAPTPPPPPPEASSLGPEFPAEQQSVEPGAPPPTATDTPATVTPPAGEPAPAPAAVPGLAFVQPGSEVFRISLLELQSGNPEKNLALQARDTVYFPKASNVYVMGSVARPGPYRYEEGMTVLQALTMAGGATDRGSGGRAKLIRIVNGKKVERKAKATEIVQPEDTLFVPERFF